MRTEFAFLLLLLQSEDKFNFDSFKEAEYKKLLDLATADIYFGTCFVS